MDHGGDPKRARSRRIPALSVRAGGEELAGNLLVGRGRQRGSLQAALYRPPYGLGGRTGWLPLAQMLSWVASPSSMTSPLLRGGPKLPFPTDSAAEQSALRQERPAGWTLYRRIKDISRPGILVLEHGLSKAAHVSDRSRRWDMGMWGRLSMLIYAAYRSSQSSLTTAYFLSRCTASIISRASISSPGVLTSYPSPDRRYLVA